MRAILKKFLFRREILLSLIFFICSQSSSYAKSVTLQWKANAEPDATGYRVYFKTGTPGNKVLADYDGTGLVYHGYKSAYNVDSGFRIKRTDFPDPNTKIITCLLSGLSASEIYYFVITAEDTEGFESNASNEICPECPDVSETIPQDGAGIFYPFVTRIPNSTSFAILVEDSDGIELTNLNSVRFAIDDGISPIYNRDLSHNATVRVVKLRPEPDSHATKFWLVYDRSHDTYGDYDYDSQIAVSLYVENKLGHSINHDYTFKVQTVAQELSAQSNLPQTSTTADWPSAGFDTVTVDSGVSQGSSITYDSNEPVTPAFGPMNEIPPVNSIGANGIGSPLNLQPPTVFNQPVRLLMPIPAGVEGKDQGVYLYNGIDWVYVGSPLNSGGIVQPEGEGWMVPGSMSYDNTGTPEILQAQVYHFSAVQLGGPPGSASAGGSVASSTSVSGSAGGGGGGCFISVITERRQ
jgi:hypothetical protein